MPWKLQNKNLQSLLSSLAGLQYYYIFFCLFLFSGWCRRSLFGCVASRSADNRLQTTQTDVSTMNIFSAQLHQISLRRDNFNNPEMKSSMTQIKSDKKDRENRQHFFLNKPQGHKSKVDISDPYRTLEERGRRLPGRYKAVESALNPITKICNLERRLAEKRKSKIDKGVENLRQPLATRSRLSKRELFNPSVISVMSDVRPERHRDFNREARKTLYKKYLQLLPIDRMLKLSKPRANTINIPPFSKSLTPLSSIESQTFVVPKIPCDHLVHCRTLNSRVFSEKAVVHSMLKPDFLVQQTKETLAPSGEQVPPGQVPLHGEIPPPRRN